MYYKLICALLSLLFFVFTAYAHPNQDTATVNNLNVKATEMMSVTSDSAFLLAGRALKLANKINFPAGKATALATIAKMHYKKGDYLRSFKTAELALRIGNAINDMSTKGNVYNVMGLIYLVQDDISRALTQFRTAARINIAVNNKDRLAANYFNVGLCFIELKQLDSASLFLHRSLAISKNTGNTSLMAMAENRLADVDFKSGNIREAIALYEKIMKGSFHSDWEDSFTNTGLAECYYSLKDYQKASLFAQKGMELAIKAGTKWDIKRAAAILHLSALGLKDYRKAYRYLVMEKKLGDSLLTELKLKDLNFLQLEREEAENKALLKQNLLAKQENRINHLLITVAGISLLFLLALVFISHRNGLKVKRLNRALQASNVAKDQLFAIIGHDLRSPINSILASLRLFNEGDMDMEDTRVFFLKFSKQMSATALMLDNLLHWAGRQQKGSHTLRTRVVLTDICSQMLEVFMPMALEKEITVTHREMDDAVINADADQIRIVLHNLIVNALKFTPRKGNIDVAYSVTPQSVALMVKDSGLGMPEDKVKRLFVEDGKSVSTYGTENEKGIGLGLMLVKRFIEMNHGKLIIDSKVKQGTTFTIVFPALNEY